MSTESSISIFTRIWFAWVCFFRVWFDGTFASHVWKIHEKKLDPALLNSPQRPQLVVPEQTTISNESALQLLALLQRDGRFIDFLEEDILSFSDAEIGAAARVVHEGCRKTLREHVSLQSIRNEPEGSKITVEAKASSTDVKFVGHVVGTGPYHGVLRHRGWRVEKITLPTALNKQDLHVLAAAEVEL